VAVRYERDRLAAVVAESATLGEVITRCGGTPTPGARDYLRRLLRAWDIDTAHLARGGVRHTEERLREAVRESTSVAQVVRRLGLGPVGGNAAHIGRRIAALGIDTSHFTRAPRRTRPGGPGRDRLVLGSPEDGRVHGIRLRAALLAVGVAEICEGCGTGPRWQEKPLRLEVDHRNGRWWDNRAENLRLLCPNCHAVTDTYRRRNGRSAC
jgi:hypothetical protein